MYRSSCRTPAVSVHVNAVIDVTPRPSLVLPILVTAGVTVAPAAFFPEGLSTCMMSPDFR